MVSIVGAIIRTLALALAAFASGRGMDITELVSPEAQLAIVTLVIGTWSVVQKIRTKQNTVPKRSTD